MTHNISSDGAERSLEMILKYSATSDFEKLFKRLAKRFRSLDGDLVTAKRAAMELLHVKGVDNRSCFHIQGYENEFCEFYKVKKFACRALKGKGVRSGVRVVYAYHQRENRIVFIEIYYKEDQKNESRRLIEEYVSSL